MRLLVLHLSDLHFSEVAENPISDRAVDIASAIKDLRYDVDGCLVAVTGDLTYTGAEEEYLQTSAFFEELNDELCKRLDVADPPRWVFVPGNHDCDFRGVGEARPAVRKTVVNDPSKAMDKHVQEIALGVQANYFKWLETFPDSRTVNDPYISASGRIDCGGVNVSLNLINTAWLSQKNESPGELLVPPEAIPGAETDADLSVTLLHHPYSWLAPDNREMVRDRIEKASDIVLSGHEHDSDYYTRSQPGIQHSRYLEGGTLQRRQVEGPVSFNVLAIDTNKEEQRVYYFEVDDKVTRLTEEESDEWERFPLDRIQSGKRFRVAAETIRWTREPGLNLTHREKDELELQDFFVYPDLEPNPYDQADSPLIRSENLPEHLLDSGHALILGDENAGKTTLAKTLFRDFREQGMVPVYLRGGEIEGGSEDDFRLSITEAVQNQYEDADTDEFIALESSERALLIDDFDAYDGDRSEALRYILNFAKYAILFANAIRYQAAELDEGIGTPEGDGGLVRYEITAFGHQLRDKLIQRWHSVGQSEIWHEDPDYAQRITRSKRQLDTVLGDNYVPARPDLILAILQAGEAAQPLDAHESSYAAYYELLIRESIAEVSSIPSYDLKIAYLARLAYWMYEKRREAIRESELRGIHQEFCESRDLDLQYVDLVRQLLDHGILREEGGRYAFAYPYYYYFFAASYIAKTYDDDVLEEEVGGLASRLHVEEDANILLFITHLSRNPVILDRVVSAAGRIYDGTDPATLKTIPEVFEDLDDAAREAVKVVYIEGDTEETRREMLRAREEVERDPVRDDVGGREGGVAGGKDEEDIGAVLEVNRALKALQIVGQIAKNYPSLDGERKANLVKACYDLGGRAIAAILGLVEEHREILLQDVVALLHEEYPSYDYRQLRQGVKKALLGYAHLISHGVVRRVSYAVGSRELELTYGRVLAETDSSLVELYDSSLRLDVWKRFPLEEIEERSERHEDNILVHSVLRRLVRDHFYLFPRQVPLQQRVCDKLGIPYRRIQRSDPRRKVKGPRNG